MKRAAGLLLTAWILTQASAQNVDFKFAPLTGTQAGQTEFTGQTKDYILAGVFSKAAIGDEVLNFAFKPVGSSSGIVFCLTMTHLGVQGNTLVLKLRQYAVTADQAYLDLFMKDGKISSSGTFACKTGKLYDEPMNETIYVPKDTAFALPDRLAGLKMTLRLEPTLDVTPTIK